MHDPEKSTSLAQSFSRHSLVTWDEADTVRHRVKEDWMFGIWQGEESLGMMDSVMT